MSGTAPAANTLAAAKVNLYLHVGPPRADGYHDVDSLVVFTEFGDELTLTPSEDLLLEIAGPFAGGIDVDVHDNLVFRAARMLADSIDGGAGARISLRKNIPVAAGVGGGSSDAAAALRALLEYWGVDLDEKDLLEIAVRLGADVPVCFFQSPAWMTGIGETVQPGPTMPAAPLVLVNPNLPLSTGRVFAAYDERGPSNQLLPSERPEKIGSLDDLTDFAVRQRNDLELPAIDLCPDIQAVKDALSASGAAFVRMSGSGPTCFGLFESEGKATAAADQISKTRPDWWVTATKLLTP